MSIYTPPGWTLVQFCPCGHLSNRPTAEVAAQLPGRLDAPILSSADCPQCKEDAAEQDRLNEVMDL